MGRGLHDSGAAQRSTGAPRRSADGILADAAHESLSTMTRSADTGRSIAVTVTFFAGLRRYLPAASEGLQRYTLPEGATVADLLVVIGIPEETDLTAGVDGELVSRGDPLRDGAEVMLLGPMDGGSSSEETR